MTQIRGSTVLVLGGAGQVGLEICRKMLEKQPAKLVVCGLNELSTRKAVESLKKIDKTKGNSKTVIVGEWGNIFVRNELRGKNSKEIAADSNLAIKVVEDVFSELSDETLEKSVLYCLFEKHEPEIVVDSINTATALAYQDAYSQVTGDGSEDKWLRMAVSMDLPQLVRHIQILYHAFKKAGTKEYVKIGTSGTGGLGFTLPFTHGENEVPSRLLMSKSGVAGAQTMLLWVLARTPGVLSVKEIKVTSLIGWAGIGKGIIETKNGPIEIYDCSVENALSVERALKEHKAVKMGRKLEGAWISTGENGIFTRDMFAAISSPDCMELILPEEIADVTLREIEGENTGKEVIRALDYACLGPTFAAMSKRKTVLAELKKLDKEELAGIPTLGPLTSKTLWEAVVLKKAFGSLDNASKSTAAQMEKKTLEIITKNAELRSKIISVGIPILLPSGKILRGPEMCVPQNKNSRKPTRSETEKWAVMGWVDLRSKNWLKWLSWLDKYELSFGGEYEEKRPSSIEVGSICGWIFAHELGGFRAKR
jgi:hypothetical protein